MIKNGNPKLSLDRPATYQIEVPGYLDERWSEWAEQMTLRTELDDEGMPTSILTVEMDQAALLGLLRRLYYLGLPLIRVECIDI